MAQHPGATSHIGGTVAAFQGGGLGPSPAAFREPEGIPDERGALPIAPPQGLDVMALLKSGAIGAEELLAIVAQLAGLGGAPPTEGLPQQSQTQQAFQQAPPQQVPPQLA